MAMKHKHKQVCESSVIPGGVHRVTVQATVITDQPPIVKYHSNHRRAGVQHDEPDHRRSAFRVPVASEGLSRLRGCALREKYGGRRSDRYSA